MKHAAGFSPYAFEDSEERRRYLTQPDPDVVGRFAELYRTFHDAPRGSSIEEDCRREILEHQLLFIENCVWITNLDQDDQLLRLNPAQLRLWHKIKEMLDAGLPVLIILLKARQLGFTTFIAALIFLRTILYRNSLSRVLLHESKSQIEVFGKYERFQDSLFLLGPGDEEHVYAACRPREGYGKRSGESMTFWDGRNRRKGLGSKLEAYVPSEAMKDRTGRSGRGVTPNALHLSELAFWNNIGSSLGAILGGFHERPGSMCIIESTASGMGTAYHNQWKLAEEGKSPFLHIFEGCFDNPDYSRRFRDEDERDAFLKTLGQDETATWGNEAALMEQHGVTAEQLNWRRRTIALKCDNSIRTFQREFPITAEEAFQASEGNYIDANAVSVFIKAAKDPVCEGTLFENMGRVPEWDKKSRLRFVRVWEEPEPYVEYVLGVDVADNEAARDYTAGVVLRRLPLKLVATFRGNDFQRPTDMEAAEQIWLLGRWFNDAHLAVERNYLGVALLEKLQHGYRYPKLVWENVINLDLKRERLGIQTSAPSKRKMMSALKDLFEKQDFECEDKTLLNECLSLATDDTGTQIRAPLKGQKRGRGTPESGYYDDLAMALAIALYTHLGLPAPKSSKVRAEQFEELQQRKTRRKFRMQDARYSFM